MGNARQMHSLLCLWSIIGSCISTPRHPPVDGHSKFDYLIVGGGLAGLTLASRLSEDTNVSVAVFEAGGFYEQLTGNTSQIPADDVLWTSKSTADVNPLVDWGFNTTPQAGAFGQIVHYARGKALGGSTARNYMAYTRGTVGSYKRWADEVGDQSYTFDRIQPYFKKSLNFTPPDEAKRGANATPSYDRKSLGYGGPLDITFSNYAQAFATWVQKGLQAIGVFPQHGFTSGSLNGSSWVIATINHTTGFRESSETGFLRPVLKRPNLHVYKQTMVKRILFRGNRAIGVQAENALRNISVMSRKEVILSAGTFQSPQLLMVSGIGPSAILERHQIPVVVDRPGVGQNMWDHVLFGPSYRVNVQTASALAFGDNAAVAAKEFIADQDGLLASPGGDFLAYEKVPAFLRQNFTSQARVDLASFPEDWPEIEYFSVGAYFGYQENYMTGAPTDSYQYATLAAALVAPLSRGNISISSANVYDQPLINPNWLTSSTDQQVAVSAYKRTRQVFESKVMRDNANIGSEYFPGSNVTTDAEILHLIKQSFNTLSHPTSTCKMGRSNDSAAVVDPQGRVYGVEKLRVVDASSLPFLPPGLPMGTIYMLAEKIADDIRTGRQ